MKKLRLLAILLVATVPFAACGDEGPTETELRPARVLIQQITGADQTTHIDPDSVEGRIFVDLAVEPGTETVSRVAITLNDTEVASQDVSVTPSSSSQVAAAAPTTVTLSVNTAAFDDSTLEVDFPNGEYELGATLETEEGSTVEASTSQALTFQNQDFLEVRITGGNSAVSGGVRWWGGGDVDFEAEAVLYSAQTQITGIGVTANTDASTANAASGDEDLDLGSGPGTEELNTDGPPFTFTAAQGDNDGRVEDDPTVVDPGHDIEITSVLDADGVNIVDQFANVENIENFMADFVAPNVDAPGTDADVTIVAATDPPTVTAPDGSGQHFSAGHFELASLSELGVGGDMVGWGADTNADNEADIVDVSSIADLDELTANEYTLMVTSIYDMLGNARALNADPVAGGDNTSDGFGVDRGAPEVTDIFPAAGDAIVLNPDDDNGDDGADSNNDLWFNAADPDLADGNPGSGLGAITVEQADGTDETVHLGTGTATDLVFDFGAAGINVGGDGQYEIAADVPDVAIVPNEHEVVWNVIIDATDPTTNMTGRPSSSLTTSNTSLTFTIEGDASDTNGLSEVLVNVREDLPGDPDGDGATCDRGDPLVNDDGDPTTGASDNADDTSIDVTANAAGFSVDVTLSNTLDAGESGHDPQVVCFFIEAADNAQNNQGDPEPNTSNQVATTTIDWN